MPIQSSIVLNISMCITLPINLRTNDNEFWQSNTELGLRRPETMRLYTMFEDPDFRDIYSNSINICVWGRERRLDVELQLFLSEIMFNIF